MEYEVREVTSRNELKDFFSLPYKIYSGDKYWVAPIISEIKRILDPKKNPYFINAELKLFNCYANNKIYSRTVIIINHRDNIKVGVKRAYFGFFETINDKLAVYALFQFVEEYCRSQLIEEITGPFNPNHYSELGLLISGFDKPVSFFQTYNPGYYETLLYEIGFSKSKSIHTRKNDNIREFVKQKYRCRLQLETDSYKIRPFNASETGKELENLRDIYNDSFSSNWNFFPVSEEEYLFSSKYLSMVTDPEHIKFCEHNGKAVGVIHFALDINPLLKRFNGKINLIKYINFFIARKKNKNLILFAVGIKKEYQHTRVFQLLLNAAVETVRKYDSLETTWMSSDNIIVIRAAERLGLKPDKEFIILQKSLS